MKKLRNILFPAFAVWTLTVPLAPARAEYSIHLPDKDWDYVAALLGKQPWTEVNPILQNMLGQIRDQQQVKATDKPPETPKVETPPDPAPVAPPVPETPPDVQTIPSPGAAGPPGYSKPN